MEKYIIRTFLSGELKDFIIGIAGVIIYLLFFLPLNIFMKSYKYN